MRYKIHSISGLTIFVFGILAVLLGAVGILSPDTLLSLLGFDVIDASARASADYTRTFMLASSMASFNMGIYYVLASLTDTRRFFGWTVPFRVLTFIIFTAAVVSGIAPDRFIGVAVWELVGALATGAALLYERSRGRVQVSAGA